MEKNGYLSLRSREHFKSVGHKENVLRLYARDGRVHVPSAQSQARLYELLLILLFLLT